jgi:hypothetical protein
MVPHDQHDCVSSDVFAVIVVKDGFVIRTCIFRQRKLTACGPMCFIRSLDGEISRAGLP